MSIDRFHRMFFPKPGLVLSHCIDCHDDCGCVPTAVLAWKPTVSPIRGTSCRVTWRYSLQRQLDLHSRQHEVALVSAVTALTAESCGDTIRANSRAGVAMSTPNRDSGSGGRYDGQDRSVSLWDRRIPGFLRDVSLRHRLCR